MGTNYYRIPTEEELDKKKSRLIENIGSLDISPENVMRSFCDIEPEGGAEFEWDMFSPWSLFNEGTRVHVGKRSGGWKFLWNFHDNKYYSSKNELFEFLRTGRIVDEYGQILDSEEFIKMSMEWGQPNGLSYDNSYIDYLKESGEPYHYISSGDFDLLVDGLRVSKSSSFS